jgi:hypothetical protein
LIIAWVVFPLVLAGLSFGCGRLVELAVGERLPGSLVLPVGFALVILAGEFATLTGSTAELAAPLTVGLALVGLLLGRRAVPDLWALGAAVAVFAVFAAPIVLSGEATFAGYIKLDDSATWFAMTDRVMEHGRDVAGLAPSTYEAILSLTLPIGYPTGALMPIGIGHQLLGYDLAWLLQPYFAFLAAMLALSLYQLLAPLAPSRPLRAFAAFVAAQPAILFGYGLWGGIKELTGACLFALLGVLVPWTLGPRARARAVLPLAAVYAAIVCVLSLTAAVWLVPATAIAVVFLVRRPVTSLPTKIGVFAAAAVMLAVPAIVAAVDWLPRLSASPLQSESDLGNLVRPLSVLQAFGIWMTGDFRLRPNDAAPTYVLLGLAAAAGLVGLWWAWRRRAWELPGYVAIMLLGSSAVVLTGSPWVGGKAIAMASPAFLAAAMAGCVALFGLRRRVEAAVVAVAIAGGVVWSNALAYHEAWLAPRDQLRELETIGPRFAGQGPTLMNTYEPYGARHFLRREDPESASELRRRFDYLRSGVVLDKGGSADIDRFQLGGILDYRTLVLRRGPAVSRPPSIYRLVWRGRYYEVWQRPAAGGRRILEHLSLGDERHPGAVPRCKDVRRLARLANGAGGSLVASTRPEAIPVLTPSLTGTATAGVTIPAAGRYAAWLGGAWFGQSSVSIDGREVGARRAELNWPDLYTDLGSADLGAGAHSVAVRYEAGGLHPGSGGTPFSFGPLTLSRENAREPLLPVTPSDAHTLCGRHLDWIEAVR